MISGDHPDPSTLDVHALGCAEAELERRYRVPSSASPAARRLSTCPRTCWRGGGPLDARRRLLIDPTRGAPLYVTDDIQPMELRKERLRKPGPPR
jgi:hypothetical protein